MITAKQTLKNPELLIRHRDKFKNIKIFGYPWYRVFRKHPYLYREFSDRFDEMDGEDVSYASRDDPTLALDLKDYLYKMTGWGVARALRATPILVLEFKDHLHRMDGADIGWLEDHRPELSLCLRYRSNPDRVEAAHYILFPHELDNLNKKEKREIGKRIMELLKEEKI